MFINNIAIKLCNYVSFPLVKINIKIIKKGEPYNLP
jgi:hypothetical protein